MEILLTCLIMGVAIYFWGYKANLPKEQKTPRILKYYWEEGFELINDYISEPEVIDKMRLLNKDKREYYVKISRGKKDRILYIYENYLWYLLIEAVKRDGFYFLKKNDSYFILGFVRKGVILEVMAHSSEELEKALKYEEECSHEIVNNIKQLEELKEYLGFVPTMYSFRN